MELKAELIESVCNELSIEYTKVKEGEGGVYIVEDGVKRKLTEKDFEDMFGVLKDERDEVIYD